MEQFSALLRQDRLHFDKMMMTSALFYNNMLRLDFLYLLAHRNNSLGRQVAPLAGITLIPASLALTP